MQLIVFALQEPLVVALVAFLVVVVVTRGRPAEPLPPTDRARFLRRVAVVGSLAVLAPFVVIRALPLLDVALRHLAPGASLDFVSSAQYRWWVFPLPVLAAIVTMVVVVIRLGRERAVPEHPVVPVARRDWLSFTRRSDVAVAGASAGLLLLVSLLAGLASATDSTGLHTVILIPGGELEQPVDGPVLQDGASAGSATFFGWAYSLPVVAAVLVLAVLAYLALRASALPPFVRPETVADETRDRRLTSSVVLRLFSAAVLLPLGGALAMIGGAGLGSAGVGIPGVGAFMWSVGYSAFAPAILGLGVAVEAAAVVMLLLAIRGPRERVAASLVGAPQS